MLKEKNLNSLEEAGLAYSNHKKIKMFSKLSSPNILEGQYNPKKLDGQYFFSLGAYSR